MFHLKIDSINIKMPSSNILSFTYALHTKYYTQKKYSLKWLGKKFH